MDNAVYREMTKNQQRHWWFRGRRLVVANWIASAGLPPKASILDAGCGTGANATVLSQHGIIDGLDANTHALAYSKQLNHYRNLYHDTLPNLVNVPQSEYEMAVMLDVLEHIEQDGLALKTMHQLLKPGGYLLLTVPAFPFLWSHHDQVLHHKRRYHRTTLNTLLQKAGFETIHTSYFNTLLLPIAILQRFLIARFRTTNNQNYNPVAIPKYGNELLYKIMRLEQKTPLFRNLPGLSLIALARTKKTPDQSNE